MQNRYFKAPRRSDELMLLKSEHTWGLWFSWGSTSYQRFGTTGPQMSTTHYACMHLLPTKFLETGLSRSLVISILWISTRSRRDERKAFSKLQKVDPVINHLKARFKSVYYPHCEVKINEVMILFKDCSSMKQYLPLKLKRSFKVWAVADAINI